MKIKRIDTVQAIIALNNNYTFTHEMYTIEYLKDLNAFRVKGVTIPMTNVRDYIFEEEELEPTKLTSEEITEAKSLPEDGVRMNHSNQTVPKAKTKVKK